jgi:hypothetical protein
MFDLAMSMAFNAFLFLGFAVSKQGFHPSPFEYMYQCRLVKQIW